MKPPSDDIRQLLGAIFRQVERSHHRRNAFERVFSQLESALSPLVGATGYYALLARAFSLVQDQYPWLTSTTTCSEDSTIPDQFVEAAQHASVDEATQCFSDVLLHCIVLVCGLIGEGLAVRLLRRTWPADEEKSKQADTDGAMRTRKAPETDDDDVGG